MSENNDTSNESNSLGSDSILQSSRLAAAAANPVIRSGVLRPSVLGPSVLGAAALGNSSTANAVSNSTAAAVTNNGEREEDDSVSSTTNHNPFMREQKDDDDEAESESNEAACAVEGAVGGKVTAEENKLTDEKKTVEDDETDERADPLNMLRKNGLERANLFAAAKSSIPLVEKSGFVFGQNVHERVLGENVKPDSAAESGEAGGSSTSGELLFSSVIQNAAKSGENESKGATPKDNEAKTLTDVAREYEESRAQKRKYEEVETFTGEENESNIVDVSCKLFAFVNSNWEERGRGSLRLNDSKNEQECSRVVFRTSGNLRLLLNTKVWAGMVAQRPSSKSLRLTAMDNTGKIKIFLVMGRPADMALLHKELLERIQLRKISHPEECSAKAEAKNGVGTTAEHEDEVKEAAATAVPDHEEATEPSPKKSLTTENEN